MSHTIRTQQNSRRQRRWAYVLLTEDGAVDFVSAHRYRSEEAARRAGEADLAALEQEIAHGNVD